MTTETRTPPDWLDRDAYPFQNRWAALRGSGSMHYIDEGTGEVLLFVHGTPTWSFEWREVIRSLSSDYRCIAPDLPGFGLSDRPTDFAYTPEAHAQALSDFVAALGLERFTLVMHDFGGPIALPLCVQFPERVERLALLNTWAWSFADDPAMRRRARVAGSGLGRLLYRWANFSLRILMPGVYGERKRLTPEIHRQYLAVFPDRDSRERVLWTLARSLLGSSQHYDALWRSRSILAARPALVIWGMKDSAFRPNQLTRWRAALPNAEVAELPVGHWPHEEAPAEVVSLLRRFLAPEGRLPQQGITTEPPRNADPSW